MSSTDTLNFSAFAMTAINHEWRQMDKKLIKRDTSAGGATAAATGGLGGHWVAGTPQRSAYALVVGIEKYRDLPPPTGARGDAQRFAELLEKSFGVPKEQIHLAIDDRATRADLERQLAWLKNSVRSGGRAYFYYSGHGAPNPTEGTAFLVPYDGDPQALDATAVKLADVFGGLESSSAKEIVAFVDACFSGAGGRSVLPAGARPLVVVKQATPGSKLALFTSSSGAETSGPSAGGTEGLFTKVLIEGVGSAKADADGDGQVTLREASDYVTPRVRREAAEQNRSQTPALFVGSGLGSPEGIALSWGQR